MTPGCLTIDFHGETLELHPKHFIWWPEERALLLSDVHLGKSATFRSHGIPVPEGETDEDLARIENLVASFEAESLIIVGDLLHSPVGLSTAFLMRLGQWFDALPCDSHLVRGNHDPVAKHLCLIRSLKVCDRLEVGSLTFVHDPADVPAGKPTITGHLHPLCRIGPKQGSKIRVPCFHQSGTYLTLPAFGTFTSGNQIDDPHGDCYPIVSGRVFSPLPKPS